MPRLEVVKDVSSQRVWFTAENSQGLDLGRPSSTPSVAIKDRHGNTVTATATTYVTQDTASTTVKTQNSVGDTSLALNAVTGIVFLGSYLITNTALQREWVRVVKVDATNKVVYLDEPLEYIHDTSATFQGTGFYRTLQTAEVDELVEGYRARATYTVDSVNYVSEVHFDVVLTPLANPLTVEFMKKRRPGLMQQEASETLGTDFYDLRETAWDNVCQGIRDHCGSDPQKFRPALVRTPKDLDRWALAELDLLLHENGVDVLRGDWDPQEALLTLERRINTRRSVSLGSIDVDFNEDDSISSDEEEPRRPNFLR